MTVDGLERMPWKRVVAAALVACALTASVPRIALADDAGMDPWMGVNRTFFRFNDALDRYALEPVAKGYHFVMPDVVENSVTHFFANLWFPVVFANCVLQAKPEAAAQSFTRFFINTSLGIGGILDVATYVDVPAPNEDFGQTLGYWGVPPGPYLVLPLFGPSDVRDTFGRAADSVTRVWPFFVPWYVSSSASALDLVNTRARYLEEISDLRESSLDYYAAVRDAYMQRRQALVEDTVGGGTEKLDKKAEDDLYYPAETEKHTK